MYACLHILDYVVIFLSDDSEERDIESVINIDINGSECTSMYACFLLDMFNLVIAQHPHVNEQGDIDMKVHEGILCI